MSMKPGEIVILEPGEVYPRPAMCPRCKGRGEWWVPVRLYGLQLRFKPEDLMTIGSQMLIRCTCRRCDGNGIVSA